MDYDTIEFNSIINHALQKYGDIFDWAFENLVNEEEHGLGNNDNHYNSEQENKCRQRDDKPFDSFSNKTTETEKSFDGQKDSVLKQTDEKLEIITKKKPRGRPRKYSIRPQKKNVGQLWEMLLQLLNSRDTNPSLIKWLSRRKGLFKLIQSEEVAKLWGEKRTNPTMNYKKMSRTIRHYYKKNIMIPVYGKKLVYQFGPDVIKCRINS